MYLYKKDFAWLFASSYIQSIVAVAYQKVRRIISMMGTNWPQAALLPRVQDLSKATEHREVSFRNSGVAACTCVEPTFASPEMHEVDLRLLHAPLAPRWDQMRLAPDSALKDSVVVAISASRCRERAVFMSRAFAYWLSQPRDESIAAPARGHRSTSAMRAERVGSGIADSAW